MEEELDQLPEHYKNQFNIGYIIGNKDLYLANLLIKGFVRSNEAFTPSNGFADGLDLGLKNRENEKQVRLEELKELRKLGRENDIDREIR